MSLNNHLDRLEQTLIDCLSETVPETVRHIETVLQELKESKERIDQVTKDLNIIKSHMHATDLQMFLSLPQITSKVIDEEKSIEDFTKSSKLGCKSVVFKAKVKGFTNSESFGDVHVKEDQCYIVYVKLKDKQAQIVGASPVTINNVSLKLVKKLEIEVATEQGECNEITGCVILKNGNYIFSGYNVDYNVDRVTLCNNNGRLIQILTDCQTSLYDVTKIDENVIAVSAERCVEIISIASRTKVFSIENEELCFGNSYGDDVIIFCSSGEGIRTYNMRSKENKLLIKDGMKISYVCNAGNHILYTSGTESVKCCDMTGKVIWTFEDTSVLRSPKGVAVDKNGICFVSGKESGNVVAISPDGKSSKEVCTVTSSGPICYDETRHQILVCNTSEAFLFQISEHV